MTILEITSSSNFSTITRANTYVVVDFYADWCGPCKTIAPLFAQLATTHAKPGKMAFVKVNVDQQQGVAREYGVSAMPTFLILKNATVTQTIRGADPSALRTAILAASKSAQTAASPSFTSSGRTLGSDTTASTSKTATPAAAIRNTAASAYASAPNAGQVATDIGTQMHAMAESAVRSADAVGLGWPVRFVGLYLWTLFSVDQAKAAEGSPFAVRRPAAAGGSRVGR